MATAASEDDNVLVRGVSRDVGGLGYFGYAITRKQDRLSAVALVAASGKPAVVPSVDTVVNGSCNPWRTRSSFINAKSAAKPERSRSLSSTT